MASRGTITTFLLMYDTGGCVILKGRVDALTGSRPSEMEVVGRLETSLTFLNLASNDIPLRFMMCCPPTELLIHRFNPHSLPNGSQRKKTTGPTSPVGSKVKEANDYFHNNLKQFFSLLEFIFEPR